MKGKLFALSNNDLLALNLHQFEKSQPLMLENRTGETICVSIELLERAGRIIISRKDEG